MAMKKVIRLDLGCGRNKYRKSFIGIDISPDVGADIVLDLEKDRLPFDDESVEDIHTSHTLEHISGEGQIHLMNECWRVLKWADDSFGSGQGKMWIEVPHKNCDLAWQDPTHKWFFVDSSFKFYCGDYLIKHQLDYGIKCIFEQIQNRHVVPEGKDAQYCTMLHVGLKKNFSYFKERVTSFPFSKLDPIKVSIPSVDSHIEEFHQKLMAVAEKAIHKYADKIMKIKIDATKRYGASPAPLGIKGLFADLNRKHERLRQWMWEGQKETSEKIMDTLADNAVYSILAMMEYDRRKEEEGEG